MMASEQKEITDPQEKKSFYRELTALALPIGMQNLLVALIGASDALMLGRLTQDALRWRALHLFGVLGNRTAAKIFILTGAV